MHRGPITRVAEERDARMIAVGARRPGARRSAWPCGCVLARDAGFDAAPLVARGDPEVVPARTIISIADERGATLIVLGVRGLGGLRSLLLGSVSHGVANRALRPVLVVPATPASRI